MRYWGRCYKEDIFPIKDVNVLTMLAGQIDGPENELALLQGLGGLARVNKWIRGFHRSYSYVTLSQPCR